MMKKQKLLVTGGAGFIGSNFVNRFEDKYDILVIDAMTYAASITNLNNTSIFRRGNIVNFTDVTNIFNEFAPDIVVNFAAETHVDNSIELPLVFTPTNIVGTQNLLELSLKTNVKKYIQISTDEVYGHLQLNDSPFTETTPINPRSPYSATKASADLLVNAYNTTYGLNTCITRCSNNFGKNQHEEKLIPKIIKNAKNKNTIPIYGLGNNIRDWIYVEDHIRGIDMVIENGVSGETYNFGGKNSEVSNLDLCKKILYIMSEQYGDLEYLIQFVDDRKGHDFRYSIDYSKAKNELGWEPIFEFEESLKKTVEYYI
jgi:dTDP-glucose 4,6-dehydratase